MRWFIRYLLAALFWGGLFRRIDRQRKKRRTAGEKSWQKQARMGGRWRGLGR